MSLRCFRWACLLLVVGVLLICLLPLSAAAQVATNKSTPFGVVAAVGNRIRADEVATAVALMQEAGVQWQREEISWDRVQLLPAGEFLWRGTGTGFTDYDRVIGAQVAAGINVLGLLAYNPKWFKSQNPPPDVWINDWYAYVYATVRRYGHERGWIKYWELWNEPNVREAGYESGLYEIKDFVRVLEVGRAAALAADPEARLVMAGMSGQTNTDKQFSYDWLDYMEQVGALGGWQYVDVLALHPYHPAPPEGMIRRFGRVVTLQDELRALDELMQRYGSKPVWITEFGYTTASVAPGVSEVDQAFYMVRAYAVMLAHPSVEKIFWYDFRNDTDPAAPYEQPLYDERNFEYHYGLLRRAYPLDAQQPDLRKPAFIAYRTMSRVLAGLTFEQRLHDGSGDGVHLYRFANVERRVDVLWRVGDAVPTISVMCGCRRARVLNWDGSLRTRLEAYDGRVAVQPFDLGAPLYIIYE